MQGSAGRLAVWEQAGGVEGGQVVEDAPDRVEELAHHGDLGLTGSLPALEQGVVEGPGAGFALDRDESGQEEGLAEAAVAELADARLEFDGRSGADVPRIQAGVSDELPAVKVVGQSGEFTQQGQRRPRADVADGDQKRGARREGRVGGDEALGFGLEAGNGAALGLDQALEFALADRAEGGAGGDRVEAVLGRGAVVDQTPDRAHQATQLKRRRGGPEPGAERHPGGVVDQEVEIEVIVLAALHARARKVVDGAWIGDHQLESGSAFESQGQIEPVDTGRLHADPDHGATAPEEGADLPMTGGRVGELPLLDVAVEAQADIEDLSADFDPCWNDRAHRSLLAVGCFRLPDPVQAPTSLADSGFSASDLPRLWRRGRGAALQHRLERLGAGRPHPPETAARLLGVA